MDEPNWQSRRPEDLFRRAEWVASKRKKGWTYPEIAAQASLDNARHYSPEATDEELESLAWMKGIAVSQSNISHYTAAWRDLEAARVPLDPQTVWLSYQLAFTGRGARERRRQLATKAGSLGPTAGRVYFLREGRRLLASELVTSRENVV